MMKKICLSIVILLSFTTIFPSFADDAVDEVVVVGQRSGGGSSGGSLGPRDTPLPHNSNDADSGQGGIAAQKKRKKYVACYNQYMTLTQGPLLICNANAADFAVYVQGGCLAGSAIVGGVAVWAASPEITLASVLAGYKTITGVGIAIGTTVLVGCQSLAGSIRTSQERTCLVNQYNTIEKACGTPPP